MFSKSVSELKTTAVAAGLGHYLVGMAEKCELVELLESHAAAEAAKAAALASGGKGGEGGGEAKKKHFTEQQIDKLLRACCCGDLLQVKKWLGLGMDVNEKYNAEGFFALYNACSYGHLHVANLLLEQGADVNAKDNYFFPLHRESRRPFTYRQASP